MRNKNFHISGTDEVRLEIDAALPFNPKCYLVVWPCSMCSCRIYRLPVERFASSGIGVLQFNPRGHGNSGGSFSYEKSFADLEEICRDLFMPDVPVVCLGHSGGTGALLKAGEAISAERYWLVSPVLDSRESIIYMYENSSINEFIDIIANFAVEKEAVKKIIEKPDWLDPGLWADRKLKTCLDNLSGIIGIGSLLEAFFIPGYNSFDEFRKASDKLEIIYPLKDSWYPEKTVMHLADLHDVPVVRDLGGKDHYFTGAWQNIWNYIEKRLDSLYSPAGIGFKHGNLGFNLR